MVSLLQINDPAKAAGFADANMSGMHLAIKLTLAAILFASPKLWAQLPMQEVMATVSLVRGEVSASGTQNSHLAAGTQVSTGSVLQTGSDGAALIRPVPYLKVTLLPSSKAKFEGSQLGDNRGESLFQLLEGTLYARSEILESEGNTVLKVKTSTGRIVGKNGQFLVEQKGDRTMLAGVLGDVSVTVGEGVASVSLVSGDVVVLQPNEEGKVVAQWVDLKSGTVVNINEDGSRGELARADPVLLALAANSMAKAVSLTLIGASTETLSAVTGLIQQINRIVPSFAEQIGGQAFVSTIPEQALNSDFTALVTLADTTNRPDMTKPIDSPDRPIASPDAP